MLPRFVRISVYVHRNQGISFSELEPVPGIYPLGMHNDGADQPEHSKKKRDDCSVAGNMVVVFPKCPIHFDRFVPPAAEICHADLVRSGADFVVRLDRIAVRFFEFVGY